MAALVVFLAVGKGKNPFNRRDLPQRLGIEIQQEGNGVTYTQAHGGHTLFKIHASRVVQYKQGTALLHDVKIELYGEDGSRVDRIEGKEFLYDQKTGIAVAGGPVEITLMRPGVAPAIAPKAAAGQAAGERLKGAPVASVAEAAAHGEIHVKTSGLTFDQKSGVATTSQHVDFSMAQGAGSSMGATYDSQQGLLVLDRAVELTTRRGAGTVHIHAQHAEFERESQICRLRAATADFKGREATAGDGKVLFRQDGSAVRFDAMNGFTLATATGGHLTSPTGHMEFDEHNQPRHGHLEGGVTMDSASEIAGQRRQMHGTAPTAELEFNAQGQLRHAHLERGVAMDSEELSEQAGQPQRLSRHWRSPIADVEFRDAGHGQIELGAVHGSGGVVVTGESQRGAGAVAPSRLSADEVTGAFGPGSALTTMNGSGHASIEETTETVTRQTTSGDRLEAHFAAPTEAGAKRGPGSRDAGSVGHGRGPRGADADSCGEARFAAAVAASGYGRPRGLRGSRRVAAPDRESPRRRRRSAAYGRQGGHIARLGRRLCARQREGELDGCRRQRQRSAGQAGRRNFRPRNRGFGRAGSGACSGRRGAAAPCSRRGDRRGHFQRAGAVVAAGQLSGRAGNCAGPGAADISSAHNGYV